MAALRTKLGFFAPRITVLSCVMWCLQATQCLQEHTLLYAVWSTRLHAVALSITHSCGLMSWGNPLFTTGTHVSGSHRKKRHTWECPIHKRVCKYMLKVGGCHWVNEEHQSFTYWRNGHFLLQQMPPDLLTAENLQSFAIGKVSYLLNVLGVTEEVAFIHKRETRFTKHRWRTWLTHRLEGLIHSTDLLPNGMVPRIHTSKRCQGSVIRGSSLFSFTLRRVRQSCCFLT